LFTALGIVETTLPGMVKTTTPYDGGFHHSGIVKTTIPYIEEDITEDTTEETTSEQPANPAETQEETKLGEDEMKAEDVLKNFKEKGATTPVKASGVNALALLWKKHQSLLSGGFVKGLTAAEAGKLKHVVSKLGAQEAYDVLAYCLDNWTTFAAQAGAEKGVSPAQQPTVAFFVMHYEIALQSIAAAAKPKAQVKVPTPVTPPVVKSAPVEEAAGVDQVQAALAALQNFGKA